MMAPLALVLFLLAAVVALAVVFAWRRRLVAAERLRLDEPEAKKPELQRVASRGLARWLFLAGYREPSATTNFLLATLGLSLFGGLVAWAIVRGGLVANLERAAAVVPGGIADLAIPILEGMPWLVLTFLAMAPMAVVRAARRRRVAAIEKELPLLLEMLATLSEAGLGFDAAIARLVDSHPDPSPLYDELRTYQTELLAGTARVTALRELRRRIDVGAVTVFISSLVQSEEVGSALTDVLRRQSEDAHARNRERALIKAEALPTKLVFPLVICYLPGLFVTTLGPTLLQFAKLADAFARGRG